DYRPSDKEVIEDVRRVAKELGQPPTVEEYKQHGRFKVETVYRRAPESHWWSVLVAFLGIEESEARKYCKRGRDDYRTDDERLEQLRSLARRLKRTPTYEEARANGINVTALYNRFGGYLKAVEAAGLDKPESQTRPGQHLTEDELLQEVRRVIGIAGKFPSPKVFDLHSSINHKTVAKKLGGGKWSGVERRLLASQTRFSAPLVQQRSIAITDDALGEVKDPMRDFLKGASVDAVKEFFSKKEKKS